jgi:hypothetical protein
VALPKGFRELRWLTHGFAMLFARPIPLSPPGIDARPANAVQPVSRLGRVVECRSRQHFPTGRARLLGNHVRALIADQMYLIAKVRSAITEK